MNLTQLMMQPNDVVNIILTCLFAFVEAYLYLKIIIALTDIEPNFKQKNIYIVIAVCSATIANFLLKNPFSYLFNIILFFINIHYLLKLNIKQSVISIVVVYTCAFISTFTITSLIKLIFNISLNNVIYIPIYRFISCSVIYFTFYLIYLLIKNRKYLFKFYKINLSTTILINLILGIIVMFIQSYILSTSGDKFSTSSKLITILSLFLYFCISMYSLIRTQKLEQTESELEKEKLYNKTITILNDNIRSFKHDFNNIIQSLGGFLDLNDIPGLKKYYKSLFKECTENNNLNVLNPDTINNPAIFSLLTNKYYLAQDKGIEIAFNVFTNLEKINCDIYLLTRILGILLDNAIEAAEETDDKKIYVDFSVTPKKHTFIISNSCKSNNISTTKIFEKGYSTKENNTGIGLWKVHQILSKNTDLDLFTSVDNNIFTQKLEVFS